MFGRACHVLSGVLPWPVQRHGRAVVRTLRNRRFTRRTVVHRYGDFQLTIGLVDQKGADWYDRDLDFEPEICVLRLCRLHPGALVFNLGAHQGVVATVLASLVAPSGHVVAVEASPPDASAARYNAGLNGRRNITIINAAVSDHVGHTEFETRGLIGIGDCGEPTLTLRTRTIDDLAREFGNPDVLFVDVDGYEVHALRGAQRVLSTRPDCYIEIHGHLLHRYGVGALEIIDMLQRHAYRLFVSSEMDPRYRSFAPWAKDAVDLSRPFHVLALTGRADADLLQGRLAIQDRGM